MKAQRQKVTLLSNKNNYYMQLRIFYEDGGWGEKQKRNKDK